MPLDRRTLGGERSVGIHNKKKNKPTTSLTQLWKTQLGGTLSLIIANTMFLKFAVQQVMAYDGEPMGHN